MNAVATRTWERTWPAEAAHVADARRGVARFARGFGAGELALHHIRLAVSEACANAIMHAGGTFTVSAARAGDALEVRVRDHGGGMAPRSDSPGAGLGLGIIRQLACAVEVRTPADGPGTEVRMTFAL
ncbi:MAG TPA: ATP-binding protein [Solirubrobacteraceae bacterium]|jgi:anti-sigma regulatory factor (Ser/Thr protein kinase)